MAKNNYWHIVTDVSKEYQKSGTQIKVGMVITHQYKKDNEGVCIMDLKEGKEYVSAYTLGYLGRFPKAIDSKKLIKELDKLIDKKGYRHYKEAHNDRSVTGSKD